MLVDGLRNGRGQVLACLTANPAAFPDCRKDRDSRRLAVTLKGSGPMALDFKGALLGRDWVAGRTVLDRAPVHVAVV